MSDDLIKRSDAIEAVWGEDINPSEDGVVFEAQSHIDRDIRLIPSADRPQEWIPCSERLPDQAGRYLCTVGAAYRNPREMYYAPKDWATETDDTTWRSTDGSYVYNWFVEAWMPLPKPWEGADDE